MKVLLIVIHLLSGSPTGEVDVVEAPDGNYEVCQAMVSRLLQHKPEPPKAFIVGCIQYNNAFEKGA